MPYHDSENLATLYPNGLPFVLNRWLVCATTLVSIPYSLPFSSSRTSSDIHTKRESAITPLHRIEKTIMREKRVFSCHNREFSGTPQLMRFVIADRAIPTTHLTALAYFASTSTHALTPAPYRHILLLKYFVLDFMV